MVREIHPVFLMVSEYIKTSLLGTLELSLFLKRGVERFENTSKGFWLSWLVPIVLIVPNILLSASEGDFESLSFEAMMIIASYQALVSSFFYLGFVWVLCWPLDRVDRFFRFGAAVNWLSLASLLLFLPYYILHHFSSLGSEELGHLLLVIVGMIVCILTFTAKHVLNVNWLIALGLALFAFVCEYAAAEMLG